jgi:hypothetical protein
MIKHFGSNNDEDIAFLTNNFVLENLSPGSVTLEWRPAWRFGASYHERGWLCTRAVAYQKAYSVAAEPHQRTNNPARTAQAVQNPYNQKKHSRAHQASRNHRARPARGSTAPTPREGTTPTSKPPYCFNCECEQKLADCQFFKNMDGWRSSWSVACATAASACKIGASNCSFKNECDRDGCKAFHHPLIHTDRAVPERTGTSYSARATSGTITIAIAFVVIRLDAMNDVGRREQHNFHPWRICSFSPDFRRVTYTLTPWSSWCGFNAHEFRGTVFAVENGLQIHDDT